MKKIKTLLFVTGMLMQLTIFAQSPVQVINISTGQTLGGAVANQGTLDARWSGIDPNGNFFWPIVCGNLGGTWATPLNHSWITPVVQAGNNPASTALVGNYTYYTSITKTYNCPVVSAWLTLDLMGADDIVTDVNINGTSLGISGASFNAFSSYSIPIPVSLLTNTTNTLNVTLNNVVSFTGLSIWGNVTINYGPSSQSLTILAPSQCPGTTLSMSGTSNGSLTSHSWTIIECNASGTPLSGAVPVTQNLSGNPSTVNFSGSFLCNTFYLATLTGQNICGTNTTSLVIPVTCTPPVTGIDFIFEPTYCGGSSLTFEGTTGTPLNAHTWQIVQCDLLGNPVSGAPVVSHVVSGDPGTFTFPGTFPCNLPYLVTLAGGNGCNSQITSHQIYIACNPMLTASASPATICAGQSSTLTGTGGSSASYVWKQGVTVIATGLPSINVSPTASGANIYTLSENNTNCKVNTSVMVNPLPALSPSATPSVLCAGQTSSLVAIPTPASGTTYTWTRVLPAPSVGVGSGTPLSVTPLTGSNQYTIVATGANGCTNTGSVTVNANAVPVINFPPIPDVNLCNYNGTPVAINVSSTGGASCSLSGPGINSVNNTFDPNATIGVGSYTLTYTCTSACPNVSASQTVNVINADYWNQTTSLSLGSVSSEDVAIDVAGNVYVVGTFQRQTTLSGGGNTYTINTGGTPDKTAAFLAKYDKCGKLLWVAHGTNSNSHTGKSIVLDEGHGIAYITGHWYDALRLNSAVGATCTNPFLTLLSDAGGYIAQYDMNTGCLGFLSNSTLNNTISTDTYPETITINSNNGDLYVGGSHAPTPTGSNRAYIMKYQPTSISLGGPVWTVTPTGFGSVINDLDFYENATLASTRLWGIGTFESSIIFNASSPLCSVTTSASGIGSTDAFVFYFQNPTSTVIPTLLRKGNVPTGAARIMTGEGISIDDLTGNPYLTGSYNVPVSGAFPIGFGIAGNWAIPTIINSTASNAYMIGAHLNGSLSWAKKAEAGSGLAHGYGVDVQNSNAYFTGDFNASTTIDGMPLCPYASTGYRTYVASYQLATGNPNWANANATSSSTAANHSPTNLATDLNNVFTVGAYDGNMNYCWGPSTAPLSSTGTNGFVLRNSATNGEFRIAEAGDETENVIEIRENSFSFDVKTVPNPTTGITEIWIEGLPEENVNTEIEIFNLTGTSMYKGLLTSNKQKVDLTNLAAGTYLLKVVYNDFPVTTRIIKMK